MEVGQVKSLIFWLIRFARFPKEFLAATCERHLARDA